MLIEILRSLLETIIIVLFSGLLTILLGILFNLFLGVEFLLKRPNSKATKFLIKISKKIINFYNYLPFLSIMILALPICDQISTTNNIYLAIVPIAIFALPLFTTSMFQELSRVPRELIEVYSLYGISNTKMMFKIILPECFSNISKIINANLLSILGYTVIAGFIGAPGLGKTIYEFGYQQFKLKYILMATLSLILIGKLISVSINLLAIKSTT